MMKCCWCNHRIVTPVDVLKPIFAQTYTCAHSNPTARSCELFEPNEHCITVDYTEVPKEENKD